MAKRTPALIAKENEYEELKEKLFYERRKSEETNKVLEMNLKNSQGEVHNLQAALFHANGQVYQLEKEVARLNEAVTGALNPGGAKTQGAEVHGG